MLAGHPKALVNRAAQVEYEQLGNDMTILEWSGSIPPSIVTFSTLPPELFKFYELLGGEQDKIMRVHPISSGTPPPGIKAGVALRLLEELEDLLITNLVKQHSQFVLDLARKRLAYMGIKYNKEDGRMLRLLGRDQEDMIEQLDVEAISKRYNMRLEHASQSAESPAAKTQKVLDLLEVKPDALTNEQVIDALELIRPEKITDPAQAAVAYAEYLVELVAQDKELPEPREGQHYIVTWNVLMAFYQRTGFDILPERAQERFRKYMLGLEFLMSEHSLRSQAFAQRLFQIANYPAFYHLPPEQAMAQLPQGPPPAGPPPGPGQTPPTPGGPQDTFFSPPGAQPQQPQMIGSNV
jgi:hypothetical protein